MADWHLTEALTRCRGINAVSDEPDILLEMARLRWGEVGEEEKRSGGEEVMGLLAEALAIIFTIARAALMIGGAER